VKGHLEVKYLEMNNIPMEKIPVNDRLMNATTDVLKKICSAIDKHFKQFKIKTKTTFVVVNENE